MTEEAMAKVTVYKVQLYDVAADAPKISRRWMTRQGAELLHGIILEDTAVEIDRKDLTPGTQWTPVGFNPKRSNGQAGFQTYIDE
jgi:hypothetical protein